MARDVGRDGQVRTGRHSFRLGQHPHAVGDQAFARRRFVLEGGVLCRLRLVAGAARDRVYAGAHARREAWHGCHRGSDQCVGDRVGAAERPAQRQGPVAGFRRHLRRHRQRRRLRCRQLVGPHHGLLSAGRGALRHLGGLALHARPDVPLLGLSAGRGLAGRRGRRPARREAGAHLPAADVGRAGRAARQPAALRPGDSRHRRKLPAPGLLFGRQR
mmetsp:Transcript_45956/g.133814  ORF Transcript_45956/g.133814 Transcript_45956/m.133814 type:complete len:216 (-) Transcript_45956:1384-2031(-)